VPCFSMRVYVAWGEGAAAAVCCDSGRISTTCCLGVNAGVGASPSYRGVEVLVIVDVVLCWAAFGTWFLNSKFQWLWSIEQRNKHKMHYSKQLKICIHTFMIPSMFNCSSVILWSTSLKIIIYCQLPLQGANHWYTNNNFLRKSSFVVL
jgi:hypothetical protein